MVGLGFCRPMQVPVSREIDGRGADATRFRGLKAAIAAGGAENRQERETRARCGSTNFRDLSI